MEAVGAVRLRIIAIGRLRQACERTLADDYLCRAAPLLRRMGLAAVDVRELPESRAATPEQRRRQEGAAILKALQARAIVIALDERGEECTSRDFATRLCQLAARGGPELAIIIGGPDGLDETVKARAQWLLALGRMTWPHRLVRVMLAEQLYRAGAIAAGLPYHRD